MTAALSQTAPRDHGGNLAEARRRFGGTAMDWLDLSTGINPHPYPVGDLPDVVWTRLPDTDAQDRLHDAARRFWSVPTAAAVLAAPGASALIAAVPRLVKPGITQITQPTYNEHAAAFRAAGWHVSENPSPDARVLVHPNNPDGRRFDGTDISAGLTVIDESFCDVQPDQSLTDHATEPGVVVLKSFGKFWGLAGLRLGFAIAHPSTIARLAEMLGPWPVSGPALEIGARALEDTVWANRTRARLATDRERLDDLMTTAGAVIAGGTDLFGLYHVDSATGWQDRLARSQIWSRIFPYSDHLIRLGLPPSNRWSRIEAAL